MPLSITKSSTRLYAITVRKTSKPDLVTAAHYESYLQNLSENLNVSIFEYVYEHEGGLHIHGIIEIPRGLNLNRFRTRGYHVHLEEMYNRDGWLKYINKHVLSEVDQDDGSDPDPENNKVYKKKLF